MLSKLRGRGLGIRMRRLLVEYPQLAQWKFQYVLTLGAQKVLNKRQCPIGIVDVCGLRNRLPNTGGFPVDPADLDPKSILGSRKGVTNRRTSVAGFEGFALDDALTFADEYRHYSFFRLAKAIANIARDHLAREYLSVLELGCGGGDLFHFLRTLGVQDYLGVDANPVAFAHSAYIRGHEDHFRLLNLQEKIDFGTTFDVVCSFEVLEHIREGALDNMISTIRRHMAEQSIFLGTASLQRDLDVHITVRERTFWLALFEQHGLQPHPKAEYYSRLLAANHPFNWHKGNTNIFVLTL
jgi:SAM-dependent methyltransferase